MLTFKILGAQLHARNDFTSEPVLITCARIVHVYCRVIQWKDTFYFLAILFPGML